MDDDELYHRSKPQDDPDLKALELNIKANKLCQNGINPEVHMDPLILLKSYLLSKDDQKLFYALISQPDNGSGATRDVLDAVLASYAGRLEEISRPGLLKGVTGISQPFPYCEIQMQPLVGGPIVRGLDDIFGEDEVDNVLSDFGHIPMDKSYVCCCHHIGKLGSSKPFLVGSRLDMERIIPEVYDISKDISLEDICPYKSDCAFKKAYKKTGGLDLKLINNPLENALLVFKNRMELKQGPQAYAEISKVVEDIVNLSENPGLYPHGTSLAEPAGYR